MGTALQWAPLFFPLSKTQKLHWSACDDGFGENTQDREPRSLAAGWGVGRGEVTSDGWLVGAGGEGGKQPICKPEADCIKLAPHPTPSLANLHSNAN